MKLTIGPSVMRSYRRLPYKAWYALAEFVDNSTQNYFNNREALDQAYAAEGVDGLTVRVVYDRSEGLLRITDNAFGMDESDLERALMVGTPPEDPSGRSRYGLGMKMAACWFGNRWSIVTKKLGSDTQFTVAVDVELAADGEGEVTVTEAPAPVDQHYTYLEISSLNRKLAGRTQGKTKDFIGSMYRLDIDKGDLSIEWNGEALSPSLDLVFLKDSLGAEYRRDFALDVNGKLATGWFGVLGKGGRPKAGFSIVYQGRMIKTWPEAWRPTEIFGQDTGSNDLVNQRLVGEMDLSAFDISHTKDEILWDDTEEEDFEKKLAELVADFRIVARQRYPKNDSAPLDTDVAVDELNKELESPELQDLIDQDLPAPEVIDADDKALIDEADPSKPDFSARLTFAGEEYELIGFADSTLSPENPYVVSETSADNKIVVIINMRHPHVQRDVDQNGLLNYLRHCTYDALAEWRATRQHAPLDGGTVKRLKDDFLRLGVRIRAEGQP